MSIDKSFSLIAESNGEEFIEYLRNVEHGFVYMINTMKNVAEFVREMTMPLTPFEHGFLSRSFTPIVLTDSSREKLIQVRMSALNQRTGYDYAYIQHENTKYKHGWNKAYHYKKKNDSYTRWIITDNILAGIGDTNNPTHHYLLEGVKQSTDDALLMIEEDYLSLFRGGPIIL